MDSAGLVYCWGDDGNGELGNNSTTQSSVPVAVTTAGTPMAGRTIVQVSAGDYSACAVDSAGLAYCWGDNGTASWGTTRRHESIVPVAVTTAGTPMAGRTMVQVSAGGYSACALASAGLAYCWGSTARPAGEQLDHEQHRAGGGDHAAGSPLAGGTITQVSAGNGFACALDSAGLAYCWGQQRHRPAGEQHDDAEQRAGGGLAPARAAGERGRVPGERVGDGVLAGVGAGTGTVTGYTVSASPGAAHARRRGR